MIDNAVINEIKNRLTKIEHDHNLKILYACESGSRAWGFPSSDSDYDVRFIYLRHPHWYLSIDEGRDVIEQKIVDEIDLSGWDLKKALKLFRKSNPPLLEWLGSPIKFGTLFKSAEIKGPFARILFTNCSMYHYLHMAEGNVRDYLKGDEVWTKKYFYVLRPLLACLWIERGLGPVLMKFNILVNELITDPDLKNAIDNLIEDKQAGKELSMGPRIPVISNFIEKEMARFLKNKPAYDKKRPDTNKLNSLFRDALMRVWGVDI